MLELIRKEMPNREDGTIYIIKGEIVICSFVVIVNFRGRALDLTSSSLQGARAGADIAWRR